MLIFLLYVNIFCAGCVEDVDLRRVASRLARRCLAIKHIYLYPCVSLSYMLYYDKFRYILFCTGRVEDADLRRVARATGAQEQTHISIYLSIYLYPSIYIHLSDVVS